MALTRLITGTLVAGCAVLGLTAAPAAAQSGTLVLPSTLTLTASTGTGAKAVELTCDPVGGNHPNAQTACMELAEASGDPAAMPVRETHRFCPMIYAPIEVRAVGLWRGKPVLFRDTYANSCVRDNKSGSLFKF
ncbi:hypothetical protein GCM10010174_12450 [Kutzneria viridogrisea]|uniref:Subtilisin inhibitor domain-containing protein n=1 Tax=Kutzneria viridogrisea TaxID=47990 RepID=A0ABR6BHP2_9PSEU|nr:hypothetical protein [Kutzneria viridogrisea]